MIQKKDSVRRATTGIYTFMVLYPLALIVLGMHVKGSKAGIRTHSQAPKSGAHQHNVPKAKPAIKQDTVDRDSFRYRLLLK